MDYIYRKIENKIINTLLRGKSVLLLGARQTGKTTLINRISSDLHLSLVQPTIRQYYEKNPAILTGEVEAIAEKNQNKPLVILDEVQKVPEILDAVQDLIDRGIAKFILTGSSLRKPRHGKINLLPGRVVVLKLDPLSFAELPDENQSLNDILLYGTLPGIATVKKSKDKEIDLTSYVTTYLEEEIRAEAIVRNIGAFARFLNLAATESGNIVNFNKLSQEIGVAHTTISSYYQILEDCLITERIEPLIQSKIRRRLTRSQKYIFFDLGVRRISAEEGIRLTDKTMGNLFEQFIALELIYYSRFLDEKIKIHFWRDPNGPEVDWILVKHNHYIPIEVKWTTKPSLKDAKHLLTFLKEYSNTENAYIVCRIPREIKLADHIYAIPWQEVHCLLDSVQVGIR